MKQVVGVAVVLTVGCHGGSKDIVGELTATRPPALVGPFSQLALTPALVGRDLGDVCKGEATIHAWCEYRSSDYPDVIFRAERYPFSIAKDKSGWPAGTLRVTLPGAGLRDKLTAAWGAPREVHGAMFWFDPAKHLRVSMHGSQMPGDPSSDVDLDFAGYVADDEFAARELSSWYGLTAAEVRQKAGARFEGDGDRVRIWPLDTADRMYVQKLEYRSGKVSRYEVTLAPDVDTDALQKALTKSRGAPAAGMYPGQPPVTLEAGRIEVGKSDETREPRDDDE